MHTYNVLSHMSSSRDVWDVFYKLDSPRDTVINMPTGI